MGRKKLHIEWVQLFFCTLWFLGALLILVMYAMDDLPNSFSVPRFISWLYDLLGVLPASIIQLVITVIGIFTSFSRKPYAEKVSSHEKDEIVK
ncbi:hypothetical protein [Isobaculum melis]|uniref:Uncharacterized protein n=1 Tax=Isobaculum melis TaxID=142588 RepID=A0A1H9TEA4_9LACT|nr:hypothetical protein [Isobaculum melis]SER95294.1 hypothetical protein SAMN04488559_11273 [Isobaculum melis]